MFFPTCQVKIIRFYSNYFPPPFLPPYPPFPPFPPPSFPPISPPPPLYPVPPIFTSALPTLRQALHQLPHAVGTTGPQLQGSDRTRHRWTSTWDRPNSVGTAGPQPGTLRTQ